MKNLIIFTCLIFSTSLMAERMKFQTPAYQKIIHTSDVTITDLQPKLRCHFKNPKTGVNKFSRKYIYAQVQSMDPDSSELQRYKVVSKRGNFFDMLPGFEVQSCAYVLVVIGKDKRTGQSIMGDIVLMGQMNGKMTREELNMLKDRSYVANHLNKRLEEMVLAPGKDRRGRRRIVNLYD